jgi:hypothetical protein
MAASTRSSVAPGVVSDGAISSFGFENLSFAPRQSGKRMLERLPTIICGKAFVILSDLNRKRKTISKWA